MLEKGSIVRSTAGRDRDYLLLVVEAGKDGVLVCDGKERPLERPKLKNPRHLADTGLRLEDSAAKSNRALRKAIAAVKAAQQTV